MKCQLQQNGKLTKHTVNVYQMKQDKSECCISCSFHKRSHFKQGWNLVGSSSSTGHILSRSSRSDLVYKYVYRFDLDSVLDHMFKDGSVFSDFPQDIWKVECTIRVLWLFSAWILYSHTPQNYVTTVTIFT